MHLKVERLGTSLKRLFQRERESINTSSAKESLMSVPVVLTGATLAPEPEPRQPPPTPTSPGDGRLRGILKKTSQPVSSTTSDQAETHLQEADTLMQNSDESNASSPKPNS